jgi:glucans biosynthesis protein
MMPSFAADRRELLFALAAIGFSGGAMAAPVKASSFRPEQVDALARAMAGRAFVAPDVKLPPALSALSYDDYRDIRFDRRHALWTGKGRIIAEPMLRGWLAKDKVELFEVAGGEANPYPFDPARFDFAKRGLKGPADPTVGFSGIRFLGPINAADRLDEIGVFQGASYFRSLGRNQLYGISARGLALGTGGPQEEFPLFRTFWLEQPDGAGEAIRVHALLDSPSIAGAYHFTIRAGETTVFDVEARLYPRTLVGAPGVAPMSSMFLFGPGSARRFDDFRRAVHDSDGLEMWTGKGERLWRPLANPTSLAVSAFADENPKGFGFVGRADGGLGAGQRPARRDPRGRRDRRQYRGLLAAARSVAARARGAAALQAPLGSRKHGSARCRAGDGDEGGRDGDRHPAGQSPPFRNRFRGQRGAGGPRCGARGGCDERGVAFRGAAPGASRR